MQLYLRNAFNYTWVGRLLILFTTPSIVAFLAMITQDTAMTRRIYYLVISFRFIVYALTLPLLTIHFDIEYIGSLICTAVLKTQVEPRNILNIFRAAKSLVGEPESHDH